MPTYSQTPTKQVTIASEGPPIEPAVRPNRPKQGYGVLETAAGVWKRIGEPVPKIPGYSDRMREISQILYDINKTDPGNPALAKAFTRLYDIFQGVQAGGKVIAQNAPKTIAWLLGTMAASGVPMTMRMISYNPADTKGISPEDKARVADFYKGTLTAKTEASELLFIEGPGVQLAVGGTAEVNSDQLRASIDWGQVIPALKGKTTASPPYLVGVPPGGVLGPNAQFIAATGTHYTPPLKVKLNYGTELVLPASISL